MTGDGLPDIVTANWSSNDVSVLTNTGAGAFGSPTLVATGTRPGGMGSADIDGDGDVDLATANHDSNDVSLLLNPSGGGAGWSNYCLTSPNSAGAGATMGASGSTSIAANNLTLNVSGAVPGAFGVFFYAAQQGFSPLGNGNLCVSGTLFRLNPPTAADGAGANGRLLDFTQGNPGSGPGQILAGSSWNFQYWYRDVAGGGQQFNFSDGLSVAFTQ